MIFLELYIKTFDYNDVPFRFQSCQRLAGAPKASP